VLVLRIDRDWETAGGAAGAASASLAAPAALFFVAFDSTLSG
jgi:hypothetical protein